MTSRRVMDVCAKPGESLTGLPEKGTQWLPGQEVRLANELTGFTDPNWGHIKQGQKPSRATCARASASVTPRKARATGVALWTRL